MMMIMTKKKKKKDNSLYIDSLSLCVCVMSYIDGRKRGCRVHFYVFHPRTCDKSAIGGQRERNTTGPIVVVVVQRNKKE